MGLFDFLKFKEKNNNNGISTKTNVEYIIEKYYSDYPEPPYINEERDLKRWEEFISFDPSKILQRKMMIRNEDGLLPGHVYQIYWIDKFKPTRPIPVYFEYEFGIDFQKEKIFLEEQGYIKNFSATESGKEIMTKYSDIINEKNNQNKLPRLDLQKELKKFDEEQAERVRLGLPQEDRNKEIGFIYQNNAIVDYKNKDFESAKHGFLKAINEYNFYSPGGVDYLAKIYRKEKDYKSEINVLENALTYFSSKPGKKEWGDGSAEEIRYRLSRARILLNKNK